MARPSKRMTPPPLEAGPAAEARTAGATGGSRAGGGSRKRAAYGKQESLAAQRKKKERERSEHIRAELDTLVTRLFPGRQSMRRGSRGRKTIDLESLLADTVALMKKSSLPGAAAPYKAGLSNLQVPGSIGGLGPASPLSVAQSPLGGAEWQASATVSDRQGLLACVNMGVMLVRIKDLVVVEGSKGLDLMCPGTPDGRLK